MHNMTGLLGAAVGVAIAAVIWAVVVSLRKKREDQPPASLGLSYFREER